MNVYIYMYICIYIYVWMYTYICMYVCMYLYMYVYTYIYTNKHLLKWGINQVELHTQHVSVGLGSWPDLQKIYKYLYKYMCIYMCKYMDTCIYTYTHIYICIHICINISYICTCSPRQHRRDVYILIEDHIHGFLVVKWSLINI
jgi:hypothetical protein